MNLGGLALLSSLVCNNLFSLFLGAIPNDNPAAIHIVVIGLLRRDFLVIEHKIGLLVKLAAVAAVPYLADLDHQVDEVLDAEDAVVGNRVLLVDGLDKEPEVVDHLGLLRVDPEVTAPEHCMEKLLLKLH